jgi:hypothetical protein
MAIASYVARSDFSPHVEFKILDSSIDYQSLPELNLLIKEFEPDVVGLRCLHWHHEQFHSILKLLQDMATVPTTIGGGPMSVVIHWGLWKATRCWILQFPEKAKKFSSIS